MFILPSPVLLTFPRYVRENVTIGEAQDLTVTPRPVSVSTSWVMSSTSPLRTMRPQRPPFTYHYPPPPLLNTTKSRYHTDSSSSDSASETHRHQRRKDACGGRSNAKCTPAPRSDTDLDWKTMSGPHRTVSSGDRPIPPSRSISASCGLLYSVASP